MTKTRENREGGSFWNRIRTTQRSIPFPVVLLLLILLLAAEVVFTMMVVKIGLLPGQYIALIIVILLAIDAGILALLGNRSCGRKRYFTGLIITVLLMILLVPGAYFVNDANNALQKLTRESKQWEKYDVIVTKESPFESVDDIRGKTVYVSAGTDKMTVEANEKLVTTADVTLDSSAKDIVSLGSHVYDEKGNTHDDVILVSESQYKMLCDEIKGFKKNSKTIYTEKIMKRSDKYSSDVNVTKDPFNIYVTGIDAWGDIDQVSRSDVNMIVTVNPQTRTILLTSMPRDSYVPLHSFGQMDKLTHSGIYGVDETMDTVTDWLGVDFDYYVKVNFTMVVKLIAAMNGITIYSDHDFTSTLRPDYHYFKGENHVGGKRALYFARERHAFEQSDETRILNQQRVMEGIINKVTTHKEVLLNYKELLAIVADNMATNLSDEDLAALARMQLKNNTKWNIETCAIHGDGATMGTYSMGMGRGLYVSIPRQETVDNAKKKIHDVMYPPSEEEKETKTDMEKLVEDQVENKVEDETDNTEN